jgi:hypothetical protein
MGLTAEVAMAGSIAVAMTPQDSAGNWRQRWHGIQRDVELVTANIAGTMSGDAIKTARDRLLDFYVRTYHLKDALIVEGAVPNGTLEAMISADADLALLADLANLDKHGRLTRRARSGVVPIIREVKGEGSSDGSGWRLVVDIDHGTRFVEGVAFARRAVDAWSNQLTRLGLR